MSFKKKLIWTITDGSEGMISQSNGLAKQFSSNIVQIVTELIFPWSKLQPGILPVYNWIFKKKFILENKPDVVISCGRKSVYTSLYLKKTFQKKILTIHIQNPKISSENFDFVIAPNHDTYSGKNVINSTGAIHHFTNLELKEINNIKQVKKNNLVSVIIGGPNQHYKFSKNTILDLIKIIKKFKNKYKDFSFCVIPSRRTDEASLNLLLSKLGDIAYVWNKIDENPYIFCLKFSKYFIVTSDSTSMISECAFTGKPVYIYHLPFKRFSKRIESFHKEFEEKGITRKVRDILENWKYIPLNEAERIAGILRLRILNK